MLTREIEQMAVQLLLENNCYDLPVPVDRLIRRLKIELHAAELDDVSGILVVEKGHGTIGYNEKQHPVRQRFTMAHELGHFVLHSGVASDSRLFIDKRYKGAFLRDVTSSTGINNREIEANRFAAALLMPRDLVIELVSGFDLDIADESALVDLAKVFQVSVQALSLRLMGIRELRKAK